MAYDTDNPPVLIVAGFTSGNAANLWNYKSGDAASVIRVSGYFSDGDDLGMTVGDILFSTDTDTGLTTSHIVEDVTAGGQADVGDGTTIADGVDSD